MNGFSFDEKKHAYYLDGKPLTGVTSVIGVLAKPALIGWAAKCACEYIWEHGEKPTPDHFERFEDEAVQALLTKLAENKYRFVTPELLEEARTAHTKKKEAAGTHGTDAHAAVEIYINACLARDFKGKPIEPVVENNPIRPFVEWAVENVDRFLFSERRMFSRELFVAGTADFGCILKTGQKLIGDFKTSSGIYGCDYYLQCAGYKILAEGEGDEKYDGCVIVRLGKKGPEDFDVTYNYDTKTAEDAFMACLTIYRAQAALKETAVQ